MSLDLHLWCGFSHWAGKPGDEMPTSAAEAISKIKEWHASSKPFLTKEAIRDINRQINQNPKKGDKISVVGLDGVRVDFDVETGKTFPQQRDKEYVVGRPCIQFYAVQHLEDEFKWNDDLHRAYCNMRISHLASIRYMRSKEPASGYKSEPKESAIQRFEKNIKAWEESDHCRQVMATLAAAYIPQDVDKIVGFACGTMALAAGVPEQRASAFQHALLLTLRSLLEKTRGSSDKDIACYAQDPIYTSSDSDALEAYQIKIVDDPDGFLIVDDSSILLSCSPNIPVKQIVTELARPAILIWNKVYPEVEGDDFARTDPDSSRVREMIFNHYDELPFPSSDDFFNMAIYVRRASLV
ncbi:hypothetical protein BGW36DRAFT_430055 [Talaromyces proteolyticus]|uniref:SRR1-like domain-containing protein n=1 Tax=Talaromyces proteolyticus TaxID=1131652 RepID=A0AAD4PYF9_9EURO|nr:uncharacterized protein BGW36DRAFT_430055 [Talaromyces proteolyticus]KAH8694031.1 hypothetical protein BGW36DRAFT_430055 [Talaromyces proteolyticus]